MSEPPSPVSVESLVILEPRRGRPRAPESCVPVSTWLPARAAEALDVLARDRAMSTSAFVRTVLVAHLHLD